MLEIIIVFMLSRRLGRIAKERGRSGAYGWLFALGWFAGEMAGGLFGAIITEEFFSVYLIALMGAVTGGVGAWLIVSNLPVPDPVASVGAAVPPTVTQLPGIDPEPKQLRRAGHCMDCDKNVWLTPTGSCPNGHGPQSITDVYDAPED